MFMDTRLKESAKTKRVQMRVAVEISDEKEYHFFVTDSIIHTSNAHIFFRQVFISYKPDFFLFLFLFVNPSCIYLFWLGYASPVNALLKLLLVARGPATAAVVPQEKTTGESVSTRIPLAVLCNFYTENSTT